MRITSRNIIIHLLFTLSLLVVFSRLSESITSKRVQEQQPLDQPPPKKQSSSSCTNENTNICAICLEQEFNGCTIDDTVAKCNHDECNGMQLHADYKPLYGGPFNF